MSFGQLLFHNRFNFVTKFSRLYHPFSNKTMIAPNTAYMRYVEKKKDFNLTFRLLDSDLNVDRVFNLNRKMEEKIESCMERIRINVAKELTKNNKVKKKNPKKVATATNEGPSTPIETTLESAEPEIIVKMLKNDEPIRNDHTFRHILADMQTNPKIFKLQIQEKVFEFSINTPWVTAIKLPTSVLAGFYVYPSHVDMESAVKEDAEYEWYMGMKAESGKDEDILWNKVANEYMYLVTKDDIDRKLKIICTPKRGDFRGPTIETISSCVVQAGPGNCPFQTRHLFTSEKTSGNKFRVTSYNLLADLYTDSDYSRTVLFPYCPSYALNIDYRKQLFIREITGYNSDIVCLQEVDCKIYEFDLVPVLRLNGLEGIFKQKGKAVEGIATFYRTDRFSHLLTFDLDMGEDVSEDVIFFDLWQKLQYNEKLVKRLVERPTVAQFNILRSKDAPNKYVLVANTHLYFHPDADHIRLLQAGLSMLYVKTVFEYATQRYNIEPGNLSTIFCGDFNSVPECGIYKLFTEKFVPESFIDWSSNPEEAVKGVSLDQPYDFESACGTPKYTNYTVEFAACLDYIFYQTNDLKVSQVVPLPSDEELQAHSAIPSVVFPSDHVALVADLEWIN